MINNNLIIVISVYALGAYYHGSHGRGYLNLIFVHHQILDYTLLLILSLFNIKR